MIVLGQLKVVQVINGFVGLISSYGFEKVLIRVWGSFERDNTLGKNSKKIAKAGQISGSGIVGARLG